MIGGHVDGVLVETAAGAVDGQDPAAVIRREAAEEGEDIEVLELAFDEVLAMVREGRIADVKTIMLLQWAALDGPFAPAHRRR